MSDIDHREMGRVLACGGLLAIERHVKAAYKAINAIDNPPKRIPANSDSFSVEEHLAAIGRILPEVLRYFTEGHEPRDVEGAGK